MDYKMSLYADCIKAFPEGTWIVGIGKHEGCSQTFDYEHPDRPQPFSYLDETDPGEFRMATDEEVEQVKAAVLMEPKYTTATIDGSLDD